MLRTTRSWMACLLLLAIVGTGYSRPLSDPRIERILEPILTQHRLPAMGAAVVTSRGLRVAGVVGIRKAGTGARVSIDDRWHLGSDTKAMTSAMIGTLVQEGKLDWSTTLGQVFHGVAPRMSRQVADITLIQLLHHRSGMPENLPWWDFQVDLPIREQRLQAVRKALTGKLQSRPGTTFLYANTNYVLAGAMAEARANDSWEDLMSRRIFEPLRMGRSVGFGPPETHPGGLDQPWAHDAQGRPDNGDNPPVMGPAGRVHCSLADWARFVADQLRGARGESALLRPETYQALQTPPEGADYACG